LQVIDSALKLTSTDDKDDIEIMMTKKTNSFNNVATILAPGERDDRNNKVGNDHGYRSNKTPACRVLSE
jgi:hypothetical protein